MQTYAVLVGVTTVTVTAAGAQGGQAGKGANFSSYSPGLGGLIVAQVSVTPLSTLYVYVGGAGKNRQGLNINRGGFNEGGNASFDAGDNPPSWGGGGGGSSDVRTVAGSLSTRLVVAGGGGGKFLSYTHFI